MNELYLLRHGIAVPPGTAGYEDDERPLTAKGERRTRQIAQGLRRLNLQLDRVITSPLPRAQRTAEIVAETLDITYLLETADALRAGQSASSIREWLNGRTEPRLMIVGHDPAFSDLVSLLLTDKPGPPICQLRKGGLAAFRAQANGRFQLDWLARPRLIRRLSK
ncbi:MAG TPA: phosphohistidine phosphatase SixA [Isosphaeraceae bacterium]|jgi:phosphohistidine phosphatase|nr:phosphohistidine phosphatase SixA [Isosphaeraceae bacterium]